MFARNEGRWRWRKMKLCFNKLVTELNHQAIIQDVRFDRNEGEFVGVVGPNGSGKSTL